MIDRINLSKREKYGYIIIDISGNVSGDEIGKLKNFINDNYSIANNKVIINLENISLLPRSGLIVLVNIAEEFFKKGVILYMMNLNADVYSTFVQNNLRNYFQIIVNEKALMDKKKLEDNEKMLDISTDIE